MDPNDFDQYRRLIQDSVNANNVWSAEQAQKQMDFQERMSNTAHQREMADLKAAGLNPILAASGSGASTPTGSVAEPDRSGTTALMGLLDKLIDSQTAQANATQSIGSMAASHILSAASSSASGLQAPNVNAPVKAITVTAKKNQKGADRTGKETIFIPVNSAKDVQDHSWKMGDSKPLKSAIDTATSLIPFIVPPAFKAVATGIAKAAGNVLKNSIPSKVEKPLQAGLSARYGHLKK